MSFKCWLSGHKWLTDGMDCVGVTMGWTGKPERAYAQNYRCDRCGAKKSKGGYYVPGERKLWPERYDKDGWPIDRQGRKLNIAGSKK